MRVLMIGCEYAGKTTLANGVNRWIEQTMGCVAGWHDHFTLPDMGQHPDPHQREQNEQAMIELLDTVPPLVEQFQRYQFVYHLQPILYQRDDFLLVNWYYADAVYAPLYYPQIAGHDRQWLARFIEGDLKELAPDMVLVLVKASPDVIRERMRREPRPKCLLKEQDVELVLDRFREVYEGSILNEKLTLDTSETTVRESMQDFLRQMEPHLQSVDRQRILCHQALQQAESVV